VGSPVVEFVELSGFILGSNGMLLTKLTNYHKAKLSPFAPS